MLRPSISSDRTRTAWTLEKTKENITSKEHTERRRFPSTPCWQATNFVFTTAFESCETAKSVLAPRRSGEEKEIDFDPEQLTRITQKERNVSQVRGDSMLKLTANRETLIHRASDQAEFSRTVDIEQFFITNDSVVDGNSTTPRCSEYSEPRISQNSRLRAMLLDHVKIGSVTEIEVSNLQERWL